MKNLVVLFSVLFVLGLTSCSDVSDNSLLVNPITEKSGVSGTETTPYPITPYPYLFNFTKLEDVKYLSNEGEDAIEFYMGEAAYKYVQLYVVASYLSDSPSKLFFVDKVGENFFKVYGLNVSQVRDIVVYGLDASQISGEGVPPFSNNTIMNELSLNGWKVDNSSISVECAGTWPSSLKYVFAEIETKQGKFFVFLQRPWGTKFSIPEYAKYGVINLKLYAYYTVTEFDLAVN